MFFYLNLLQYQKNSAFSALPINKGFFTPLLLRFYSAETLKNSARLFGLSRLPTDQRASESLQRTFAEFLADQKRTFFGKNSARF